ncbi:Flp family type IVb pilin [Kocuria rosea]|uniref:Flp family type IVb pilin n=1 Tax=Kocuria rosea TaxID=1275 RepID=UPI00203EBE12|nr:Flp family type IVb pilin [Kocuria rosea]MCM3688698.1 Flp family type IVb pilin [Kocuria rosea]
MLPLLITIQTFFANTADRLKGEQKGATAVEYGLIVGVIAVAILSSLLLLDGQLDTLLTTIASKIKVS